MAATSRAGKTLKIGQGQYQPLTDLLEAKTTFLAGAQKRRT